MPLNKRLKKKRQKSFKPLDKEKCATLEVFKEYLTISPVLPFPRNKRKYTLDTDACDKQIGCVLLEEQQDGNIRLVRYWSRRLADKEREVGTAYKECLAVVWSVTLLRAHLEEPALR